MKYILIVDDEVINQALFTEMLSDDYEVDTASDGYQCLESVANRKPDMILLDVTMPGIDGLEVCRRLRASEETKDIPIILASAHVTEEHQKNGIAAGANDYICKPFYMEELTGKIDNLLGN